MESTSHPTDLVRRDQAAFLLDKSGVCTDWTAMYTAVPATPQTMINKASQMNGWFMNVPNERRAAAAPTRRFLLGSMLPSFDKCKRTNGCETSRDLLFPPLHVPIRDWPELDRQALK